MEIHTILTPAEIASLRPEDLGDATCVVFDVLRATSTILAALSNGAPAVWPVSTPTKALAARDKRLPGALLGGERGGLRLDGFDLGNSPREYTAEVVGGREIITSTTNGTVALRACAAADTILAAALANLDATARWLRAHELGRVLLICAGTGTNFALEDGLAAGGLALRLGASYGPTCDDATAAMMALYASHRRDLEAALTYSVNGQRLVSLGLGEDVVWCARESWLDTVAVMEEGALRAARNLLPDGETAVREELPPTQNME